MTESESVALPTWLHPNKRKSGGRRIRTFEGSASRFTVCPLWPTRESLQACLFRFWLRPRRRNAQSCIEIHSFAFLLACLAKRRNILRLLALSAIEIGCVRVVEMLSHVLSSVMSLTVNIITRIRRHFKHEILPYNTTCRTYRYRAH